MEDLIKNERVERSLEKINEWGGLVNWLINRSFRAYTCSIEQKKGIIKTAFHLYDGEEEEIFNRAFEALDEEQKHWIMKD